MRVNAQNILGEISCLSFLNAHVNPFAFMSGMHGVHAWSTRYPRRDTEVYMDWGLTHTDISDIWVMGGES